VKSEKESNTTHSREWKKKQRRRQGKQEKQQAKTDHSFV
jgi:hypothetical protein